MRKNIKLKAWILIVLFVHEIFMPIKLLGITSGPAQPEMAAFTPAGVTDMVDPFTGDFTYNIPLMDIEGYPVNIAYNSGVTMEQEASWVGLGWNLNVGTVNRSVRGLPDDFKGDEVTTETHMKDMTITKVGFGGGAEALGIPGFNLKASKGFTFIYNNYKGFGLAIDNSIGISSKAGGFNANIGYSLSSLDGTSVNGYLGLSTDVNLKDQGTMNFGGSLGTGYNTRTGQFVLSLGTTAGYKTGLDSDNNSSAVTKLNNLSTVGASTSLLPIGMETYTPYPSIEMESKTLNFSGTVGGEIFTGHPHFNLRGSRTVQEVAQNNIDKGAYGYMYSENASEESLRDFNREKPVALNKTVSNLSPINFTYDVFSVSGQGVSGTFRPFRNDIGLLNDPATSSKTTNSVSIGLEIGLGGYFRAGTSVSTVDVKSTHGSWIDGNEASKYNFLAKETGSLFENYYFKAAGEKAVSNVEFYDEIGGDEAVAFDLQGEEVSSELRTSLDLKFQSVDRTIVEKRELRSKLFSVLTAEHAEYAALDDIKSTSGSFYAGSYVVTPIARIDANRKAHHISEIRQTNPDGEQFVYGVPAYNLTKKEVSYTVDEREADIGDGKIAYDPASASENNDAGIDGFYSKLTTPPYAHSYLLSAKLSSDYKDVTGDGITPDDVGNAYKFNYQRTSTNYKWRIPFKDVNFMEGFKTNDLDQKASYTYGEKEMWYLHTIQSKNQVAEFYISPRDDAYGTKGETGGLPTNLSDPQNRSFRLDSILLFNKLDRLENKAAAIPLKKVSFSYDYSLCKGVNNQKESTKGKLTLKEIEITYGRSDKGAQSPYVFAYSNVNPDYNPDHIDRWGNYKPNNNNPAGMINADFPYVLQNLPDSTDHWASAWSLKEIVLPSGGKIKVEYESDDYAYVQNKTAMQMYTIAGAGQDENFNNSNHLYDRNFLYINRPDSISPATANKELRELFFGRNGSLPDMYFKFLTSIGKTGKEYAAGYTKALDIGVCPDNSNYLYIELEPSDPNPISKIAWGFFRQSLFEILYDQPKVTDTGLESVLRGMVANAADIIQMFVGVEDYLKTRSIANNFDKEKSFIRLNSANKIKKGGGSRVKRIELHDNWKNLSGEGENSAYGQEFIYTTIDENGNTISSGVATYEPMIGNDENPFRTPVPYVAAASSGHIPAIEDYQETPFGEIFFPSASVGYSNVT